MANVSHRRAAVKPVAGTCRWVRRLGDGDPHSGVLLINGRPYGVVAIPGGYRVVKPDGVVYDLDARSWACTCPDAVWRQRQCKHAKAVRAALAQ
jgi:hypothetical protein